MEAKPGDMQQPLLRNRAKTMKLVRKLQFFRPKSAIMDFFWNFFSQSKILQLSGQNETKHKLIPPFFRELWPKMLVIQKNTVFHQFLGSL